MLLSGWARVVCAASCFSLGHGTRFLGQQHSASNSNTSSSSLDTPVTRVVTMLKDMEATLKTDMEEDQALYGNMACWCHDENREKTADIQGLESTSEGLTATIDGLDTKISKLDLSIKRLEEDIAHEKQSLADATSMRKKEADTFHADNLDATQALEAVRAALEVLSKHHGDAFPQLSASFIALRGRGSASVRTMDPFDDFLKSHGIHHTEQQQHAAAPAAKPAVALASSAATLKQRSDAWAAGQASVVKRALEAVTAFLHRHRFFEEALPYNAQSSEIVGILKTLEEQMQADLSDATKTEEAQASSLKTISEDKMESIQVAEKQAEDQEDEHAQSRLDLANAKADLEQTEKELAEAKKYKEDLEARCQESETSFAERKSVRKEEITAVGETIQILMGDEARDAMSATFNSFFQLGSARASSTDDVRMQAAAILRKAAVNASNPSLSILATRAELDSFTKVKEAIDKMVLDLKQAQENEVKHLDDCKSELHKTELSLATTSDTKVDLEATGDALNATSHQLSAAIEQTQVGINELQVALQKLAESRLKENLEFQKTMSDQVAVENALKEALQRLSVFYNSHFLLIQAGRGQRQAQAPPMPQKTYTPHAGAPGVMELVGKIIQDTKDLQYESRAGEKKAQAEYEAVVTDTSRAVATLKAEAATKQKGLGETGADQLDNQQDIADTGKKLDGLGTYKASLQEECDWLINNFEIRQTARSEEIEALQSAKQILNGASYE